ncbi:hypothetical protein RvY_07279-2 [Ramazzottius varieornatus]|uniref:FAD-binding PCMH-type domain-containing protein n=1 Tax=Ramazzottius varieornatus TaxID=947166 RepID=A0A1D1V1S3_RAMVA|nr:hypothetical protein RvY_07279-2 [Ramazzottius varieornatus]
MENPDDMVYTQARNRLYSCSSSQGLDVSGANSFEKLQRTLSMELATESCTKECDHAQDRTVPNGDSEENFALAANDADSRKEILYNWSGIKCIGRRSQILHPKTDVEVSNLIKRAKSKVHIVGSALSYEKIMTVPLDDAEARLLSLDQFTGLISVTETTVTFGGGTPINDLVSTLSKMDRMLGCSLGVIGIQTIAGAISTGTHGQGLFQSDFASMVQRLKVVLPDGTISTVTPSSELPLGAIITSMGTLAVILEVEVLTEPRRVFHCKKLAIPYEDFLESYDEWNRQFEHVKVWWFPETDLCQVWLVEEASAELSKEFLSSDRTVPVKVSGESDEMNHTVDKYLQAMSDDTKAATTSDQPQFRTVRRFADAADLVGYHEQILCKGIPVPQINCEIAIPLNRFQEATKALHEWAAVQPGRIHYPFIYRATGKSAAWLSPAASGPVVWIGFLVYVAEDGSVRSDGMETMKQLQIILEKFNGLPHWGKHYHPDVFHFGEHIEKFSEFLQLRRRLDPSNKFLSNYLEKIFI